MVKGENNNAHFYSTMIHYHVKLHPNLNCSF